MSTPFLKWAGGKRWLAASPEFPVPAKYRRYVEPFLGGGAVFFKLNPSQAILSDINQDLIELYQVMSSEPTRLKRLLEVHHALHSRDYYYLVRSAAPEQPVERAARTLYLNRTCWNGLYRVNTQGQFNVPIGTKTSVVFDNEDFEAISEKLQKAHIVSCDFEETISDCDEGDFLFIDPPYTVKHNLNGFVKYNEKIFSWSDQVRLREAIRAAIGRGVAVVATNADHESVKALYKDVCEYRQLTRASILASDARRRGQFAEALFVANIASP